MKYLRERILHPQNTMRKKFGLTKYPREKFWTHKIAARKKIWTHGRMMMLWHETSETRDGTRLMEFITFDLD